MCCLFGLLDPNHAFSGKTKTQMLHTLATVSESRGVDASGIAFHNGREIQIVKHPVPGHKLKFHVRSDTSVVMGHTRMATQGNAKWNENNHPFIGNVAGRPFALAHNGVILNDEDLRAEMKLPKTQIETDSYIAVQILEALDELSFEALQFLTEQLYGSFTFTILDDEQALYIVRGENPMCLCRYPSTGLLLYASTMPILCGAIRSMPYLSGRQEFIPLTHSNILKISSRGEMELGTFETYDGYSVLGNDGSYGSFGECYAGNWRVLGSSGTAQNFVRQAEERRYLLDLKSIAVSEGLNPMLVDHMIQAGFSFYEIEDFIYNQGSWDGWC